MAKRENKTQPTQVAPAAFIAKVEHPTRRADAERLLTIMREETGETPRMWGPSIIGFGRYHYRYASGHEGDAPRVGFSPRKAELVLYLLTGAEGEAETLARLGPHRSGKSCLYVKRLSELDEAVLRALIRDTDAAMKARDLEA